MDPSVEHEMVGTYRVRVRVRVMSRVETSICIGTCIA